MEKDYMFKKIDTSAEDYAREAERLRSEKELQRQQEMMYHYNDDSNYIEPTGRHR